MATISGKSGKIMVGATTIADITRWILATTSNNPAYASSSTGGFKKRVAGVKDATGVIAFKLDLDSLITDTIEEGAAVTLLLYLNGSDHYSVPAVIDSVRIEVDIDSGDVVGGLAEFSSNGAWTKPS